MNYQVLSGRRAEFRPILGAIFEFSSTIIVGCGLIAVDQLVSCPDMSRFFVQCTMIDEMYSTWPAFDLQRWKKLCGI